MKTRAALRLEWRPQVLYGCSIIRRDRALFLAVQEQYGKIQVLALEGPFEASLDQVFNDHAHAVIGTFHSWSAAFDAAERYARNWKPNKKTPCECAPIQGAPAIESSARRDGDG